MTSALWHNLAMEQHSGEAFILHQSPCGETSARVTFFSRAFGVFTTRVRGGRKQQSLLQPFLPLWIATVLRQDWLHVNAMESRDVPAILTGDALFAGLYANELLSLALHPMDACPELFEVVETLYHQLASAPTRDVLAGYLRTFEWTLLAVCGYVPSLHAEAHTEAPLCPEHRYRFVAGVGLVPDPSGIPGALFLDMASGQPVDTRALRAMKYVMREAIDYALGGKVIRTRTLFSSYQTEE